MKWVFKNRLIFMLAGLWVLLSHAGIETYILPSIYDIVTSLTIFLQAKQTYLHIAMSFLRVVQAFVIACMCGGLLGIICGRFKKVYEIINPVITLLKAIPGIGWLPLAIIWFGISNGKSIFLMSLASFFPIYLSCYQAIYGLPKTYREIAMLYDMSILDELYHISFPGGFAQIMVGIRNGMAICWAYLVLAEISGTNMGLGVLLNDARMLGKTNDIVMLMIVFAILGKICDIALVWIAHHYKGGQHI